MAYSYEQYERQQRRSGGALSHRNAVGYWLPLGLTILTLTAGFAAWIWNERNNDEQDDSDDAGSEPLDTPLRQGKRSTDSESLIPDSTLALRSGNFVNRQEESAQDVHTELREEQDSVMSKMSGAIWRTSSPQQLFDGASKRVAAGVAAAGAIVGRGLSAIQESNDDFRDHERWAEPSNEAPAQPLVPLNSSLETRTRALPRFAPPQTSSKKRLVAVTISAVHSSFVQLSAGQSFEVQHGSIISHLPQDIDHSVVELVILIYAPNLKAYPLQQFELPAKKLQAGSSAASSFSNISIPAIDIVEQLPEQRSNEESTADELYASLQASAMLLVSHPSKILPFTTPSGHIQLLRHLSPSLVYVEESLSGANGEHVREIESWVGQVIVVIGGEGLVDTETEDEGASEPRRGGWWKDESRIGLGKADVVEVTRISEDWMKRIM